jgi:hypothetical protein
VSVFVGLFVCVVVFLFDCLIVCLFVCVFDFLFVCEFVCLTDCWRVRSFACFRKPAQLIATPYQRHSKTAACGIAKLHKTITKPKTQKPYTLKP